MLWVSFKNLLPTQQSSHNPSPPNHGSLRQTPSTMAGMDRSAASAYKAPYSRLLLNPFGGPPRVWGIREYALISENGHTILLLLKLPECPTMRRPHLIVPCTAKGLISAKRSSYLAFRPSSSFPERQHLVFPTFSTYILRANQHLRFIYAL